MAEQPDLEELRQQLANEHASGGQLNPDAPSVQIQSLSANSSEIESQRSNTAEPKAPEAGVGRSPDELLKFDNSCMLGHLYLQIEWKVFEKNQRAFYLQLFVEIAALACGAILGSFVVFHFVIPVVFLIFAIMRYAKWRQKIALLEARGKLLRAASWALRDNPPTHVKYSVEDLSSDDSIARATSSTLVPNARIMMDGGNSVPAYCGSCPIKNWRALSDADRSKLPCGFKTYCHGKLYHDSRHSFVILTDAGVVLWFV